MNELINGAPVMSSVELVELINSMRSPDKAELRHDNFMAKIEKHPGIDSPKFLGQYKDSTGRSLKCYYLPKRECELMVMSESLEVQAKVLDRLIALEAATPDPLAALPPEHRALVALMCENAQIKARQDDLAATQVQQQESIKRIEAKQCAFENGHSFFTAVGFCALREIKLEMKDLQRLGRLAGKISRDRGIPIDKVRDVRYGVVNSYHEETLVEALNQVHGGM